MAENPNVNRVVYGNDTIMDITDTTAEAADVAAGKVFYARSGARSVGTGDYMDKAANPTAGDVLTTDADGQAIDSGTPLSDLVTFTDYATGDTYGLVKLNPSQNIDVNADGQLTVGGRLGQYPDGGVYYPDTIEPGGVGASSFLMTDGAKELSVVARTFGIMAGVNLTCKNTAAGSTTYRASNSQTNRFICAAVLGGRAALSQADATENGTAAIVSIEYANGDPLTTPYFGATESTNDIIITLERTVNPDAATKALRLYGTNKSTDNILVGQGVAAGGGKALSLGQATFAGGNQCIAFGNSAYVNANNSVGFGHTMFVNKQYCFASGQGHDFTDGANGTAALGTWSEIGGTTKLAVGDGTAYNARSNIFEVRAVSGASQLVIKSPNGTKYAITVADDGTLGTSAV